MLFGSLHINPFTMFHGALLLAHIVPKFSLDFLRRSFSKLNFGDGSVKYDSNYLLLFVVFRLGAEKMSFSMCISV